MDARVEGLARRQHGAVSRRQALTAGLTEGQVEGLVRRRALQPVSNGVYVVPGSPPTRRQEAVVATLRCGPQARVAGPLGLALTGVAHLHAEEAFSVLLRPGRRVRNVPWRRRHDRWPGLGTPATADGVPTFGVARNLLETAVDAEDDDSLRRAVDAVRWLPPAHMARVRRLAAAAPDHGGARRLHAIGALAPDAPASSPERWLADLLAAYRPRTQVEVAPGLRVDVLIEQARLVLEYDGRATHSGPWAVERDARRDERLRALGYLVIHVTAADRADPTRLLARVRAVVDAVCG